jgi:hypothetical protein
MALVKTQDPWEHRYLNVPSIRHGRLNGSIFSLYVSFRATHVLGKSCERWEQKLLRGETGARGWREVMITLVVVVVQVEETDSEEAAKTNNKVARTELLFDYIGRTIYRRTEYSVRRNIFFCLI